MGKIVIRLVGIDGIKNMGWVDEGNIVRGAQPEVPKGYNTIKSFGYKTVINLRKFHDDTIIVKSIGLKSFQFPMTVFHSLKSYEITKILAILLSPKYFPIFIHCQQGHDRTGAICACYRLIQGWSMTEVLEELEMYGYNSLWTEMKETIVDFAKSQGIEVKE